ncbi:MAG: Na+/H+ antiporter NhaC family protein [Spirochaetota bacterium]
MDSFGIIAIIPFVLSLFFLIWQKEAIFPIIGGLFIGCLLLQRLNPVSGFLNVSREIITATFLKNTNILTVIVIAEVLLLFYILDKSRFIRPILQKYTQGRLATNKLESIITLSTVLFFIDRNLCAMLVGTFSRPFADKKRLAPVKHAYLLNTASSAFSTIIPFTTLTPVIVATIGASFSSQGITLSPVDAFYRSIQFQYFNIFSFFIAVSTLIFNRDILLMQKYKTTPPRASDTLTFGLTRVSENSAPLQPAVYGTLASIVVMVAAITGGFILNWNVFKTIHSTSIEDFQKIFIGAVFAAIIFSILYSLASGCLGYSEWKQKNGYISRSLFYTLIYLVLCMAVETLAWRLGISGSLMALVDRKYQFVKAAPLIIFLFSSIISFLCGSSLFTIITVLPAALSMVCSSLPDPLMVEDVIYSAVAAVLSGATFGGINSPFSVNLVISTASAESSVTGHFKTQIVYSGFAFFMTVVFGYLFSMMDINPVLSISSGILVIYMVFRFVKKNEIWHKI